MQLMAPQRRFILENHAYHTISVTRGRQPVLSDPRSALALLNAIQFERTSERAYVLAYAILPDHLHLLLVPREPSDISVVMRNLKSYAAKSINEAVRRSGPLWQSSFYDRVIRDEAHLERTIEYVHCNPVVAGLSARALDYPWSSAHPSAVTDVERFLSE